MNFKYRRKLTYFPLEGVFFQESSFRLEPSRRQYIGMNESKTNQLGTLISPINPIASYHKRRLHAYRRLRISPPVEVS